MYSAKMIIDMLWVISEIGFERWVVITDLKEILLISFVEFLTLILIIMSLVSDNQPFSIDFVLNEAFLEILALLRGLLGLLFIVSQGFLCLWTYFS